MGWVTKIDLHSLNRIKCSSSSCEVANHDLIFYFSKDTSREWVSGVRFQEVKQILACFGSWSYTLASGELTESFKSVFLSAGLNYTIIKTILDSKTEVKNPNGVEPSNANRLEFLILRNRFRRHLNLVFDL